jgi:methanol--5-hydroxybenzimidazolylcobamide Co-methyltransferase
MVREAPRRRVFLSPAISNPADLMFGRAPQPVRCGPGLTLGAGQVFPEINFTLPPMLVEAATWSQVRAIYASTIDGILARSRDLELSGLLVEFEHLPPMTAEPAWGAELTELLKSRLIAAHDDWGLAAALRVTIVDLRDEVRPPRRRSGRAWEQMCRALEGCAAGGADVLSIESTGGKEVHDLALTRADLAGILLALGVLAPADMAWLWDTIVDVAGRHGIVAGGDSACGFANTAMQLAGRHMLPDVLAAVVRAMSGVRSLVAYERGAIGPSKDCAYEGPVLKAITGCPISMEGRSATCAHLSPIGNIAGAAADAWSNESVPDVQLLSGPAPIASLESLAYDCRLFNAALRTGVERQLRDLHVASDSPLNPQAALMTPEATVALARAITAESDPYPRTLAAGRTAFELLRRAAAGGALRLPERERRWLDKLESWFEQLPGTAEALWEQTRSRYGALFDRREYDLAARPESQSGSGTHLATSSTR